MTARTLTSTRIVIVGGGISGLSIAVRLAQAGLPVTVLEASQLGFGASTRNQGWLVSGGWFAPRQRDLARLCHESLEQTLRFCPDCPEPDCGSMVYMTENPATDNTAWTSAWSDVGIPYEQLTADALFRRFPELAISRAGEAFALPDRAIRTELLLRRLAAAAENAGVEIRTGAPVSRLLRRDDAVEGVETGRGELMPARLVILAGNARGGALYPGYGTDAVGTQSEIALVALKTHLVAVRPGISRSPLCVLDAGGFNHIPHPPGSVFGSNRWLPVRDAEEEHADPAELARIWDHIHRLFPDIRREDHAVREWAGTTIQAMHVEQVEPGEAPLPTVVDHQWENPAVENLLSVFPGRASLWPHLAELAQQAVLTRLEAVETPVATPPWGTPTTQWDFSTELRARNDVLYHCQTCGNLSVEPPRLAPPQCCGSNMVHAAECRSRYATCTEC
jgi:glycine/D-amino acid oxidase-like deaminating enzyme